MSDQNLWSSRENGCFISKNRIMLFLSFLGSDSYQAAEQSSSKFKAKMDGSLWMAHLVCYKTFYKAIHVKVNKSLEAEAWLICFLCLRVNNQVYWMLFVTNVNIFSPPVLTRMCLGDKKVKAKPLLHTSNQINSVRRTFNRSVETL